MIYPIGREKEGHKVKCGKWEARVTWWRELIPLYQSVSDETDIWVGQKHHYTLKELYKRSNSLGRYISFELVHASNNTCEL